MIPIELYFQDDDKILQKLQGKELHLNNVEPAYIKKYSKALVEAKAVKTEAALNKVFHCALVFILLVYI